jgi:hypothetical protein
MRLREHPKIQWPPRWSELSERCLRADEGILRDVDLIEPQKLLLSNENEWTGKFILPNSTVLIPLSPPDCTKKLSPLSGDR